MRSALLLAALLLLWIPLLWPRSPGPQDLGALPVQARLQADLAGRLLRLVDLHGTRLPPAACAALVEGAAALLDQGLEQQPAAPYLLVRRALVAARAKDRPEALRLLGRVEAIARTPVARILEQSWRGGPAVAGADAAIQAELAGYYRYLALVQAGEAEAARTLQAEEYARARADLGTLSMLGALTAGSLVLGVIAWLLLPWLSPRWAGQAAASQVRWNPLAVLLAVAGLQWLAILVGGPVFGILGAAGLTLVAAGVTVQILVYAASLALLVRLLPNLTLLETPLGAPATVGLDRPGWRHLEAGVAGFCMATPAVLVASWLTSALLGHSPFSSNPALEVILRASRPELVAVGLMAAVAAPFFEEILFRGVLFASLRRVLRPVGAGLASAALFSLLHGDSQAILVLGTLGALFSWLYERTGSLWPAILAHGLWNGSTVAAMALIMAS